MQDRGDLAASDEVPVHGLKRTQTNENARMGGARVDATVVHTPQTFVFGMVDVLQASRCRGVEVQPVSVFAGMGQVEAARTIL